MIKKNIFFCFLFLNIGFVNAQDFEKSIDSLKQVYRTAIKIETKIDASIGLGKIYNRSNVDSAMTYFKKAVTLSEKNNLTAKKTESYSSLATSYIIKGKFDSSHYYFDKSEKLLDQATNYKLKTSFYGDKGILHYYEGNIDKAAESFQNALVIAKAENDNEEVIRYSNNTALAYTQLGKNEEAIEIYYDVLKLAESEGDKDHIGKILNNIGLIYENMNQFEEALGFYKKAFQVKKASATQIDIANAYYNMANMQLKLGENKKDSLLVKEAKTNFLNTLSISEENEYGNGKLYGFEGLGQIALNEKKYDEAKEIYIKMDSIASALNNQPIMGVSNLKLGVIAIDQNHFDVAKRRLVKAKEIIEKTGAPKDKAQLYSSLNALFAKEQNYKEAYRYLKLEKEIEEQLSSKNLQDKISNYEVKYQTEKKEKEILSQRADLAEKELSLNIKNTQLIGLVILAIVISLLGYLLFNQQKLKHKQLKKESELKEALVVIETQNKLQDQRLRISRDLHDNIGAQLTFIISSLDNLKYGFKLPDNLNDKLKYISEFTTSTIYELRDTIWAMNKSEISFEDLQSRISNFIEKANKSSEAVTFNFNVDQELKNNKMFTSVQGMNMYRIIQEAINNALKYAKASQIDVDFSFKNRMYEMTITDNGIGFDINQIALGNGLNNMKKRAHELDAEFEVTSVINKGTIIRVFKTKNT
ncbi:two-component sensor histidine kinase [Flavobacteriaceae bacterium LYZ1037]|nr:two-component sensor histidine kinase [Flavobacteriaceae bacterium LYZ1037]